MLKTVDDTIPKGLKEKLGPILDFFIKNNEEPSNEEPSNEEPSNEELQVGHKNLRIV
jgi:hypothetical protein